MTYKILDNGGSMVSVTIKGKIAIIHIPSKNKDISIKFKHLFVGKSPKTPMTEFSGGYGPKFDGNSLLLALAATNTYMFIGETTYKFTSKAKITTYVSEVGNSGVPYPYAIDKNNTYYLMVEYVFIDIGDNVVQNPYRIYYNNKCIGHKYKIKTIIKRQ
jgi:hypothetical protein